jgi:hypothetical protein
MAKTKGPLFSVTARGSFGPRLTFSKRTSGQQVRYQRAQKDRNSDAQNIQRAYFLAVVGWWGEMTTAEQAGFNGYTKEDQ